MLLSHIYLRNFRVFEDELDLDLPPGLVGIFGPNGAGKSTLLESITWTLWGRARTSKEEIRSAGVGGECVTELTFEHEGHLYVVRRSLAGANATVRAQAQCDGLIMSEGVRDTARYVHSVLGVDDAAFRASVFAEQKQLAAFSNQTPAERRKLVLQLLGITPLDAARDAARKDAKSAADQYQHLRRVLPDLEALQVMVDDAEARAGAAEATAAIEEAAAAAANERAEAANATFAHLDAQRQVYDHLVVQGRAARAELDSTTAMIAKLTDELNGLADASVELASLQARAEGLDATESLLRLLDAALEAAESTAAVVVPEEPKAPDEPAHESLAAAADDAAQTLAVAESELRAAQVAVRRAKDQAERSATLSTTGDCPLCGQELGEAYAAVQAHRHRELSEAALQLEAAETAHQATSTLATAAASSLRRSKAGLDEARRRSDEWRLAAGRRSDAVARWERALTALGALDADLASAARQPAEAQATRVAMRSQVDHQRQAASAAERLRGRLERRPQVEGDLRHLGDRLQTAQDMVDALLQQVRSMGFDNAALIEAQQIRENTARVAREADVAGRAARLTAAQERTRAEGEATRLADGRAQHAQLAQLEVDSRHLARVAELLNAFRNTVVASVGPRLAVQAAELFGELTDHEYDQLEVDAETYELKISDAGRSYGLERFSGSEVDLANLALRVAISEHVRFQSGGSVGLLVLDEVFGPLDEERKARMLIALDRLRGRFRQILVVTHASDIKDQLPHALEVVKLPGRRATARLING